MSGPGPTAMSRSDAERNHRMLLEAAAGALARRPDASMAQVARAAGLARATLYRHFSTRAELLAALRAEALLRAREEIAASRPDEGAPLDALRRAIKALAGLGVRFRAVLLGGADLDPAFLQARGKVLQPLHDVVRRGQQTGVIRGDVPAEWVVTALASMLVAAVHVLPDESLDETAVTDLVHSTLTSGVATRF